MEKAAADSLRAQVRSAFPEGTIAEAQALDYGDDPEIEPGHSAIRIFINQQPQPEAEPGAETLHRFLRSHHAAVRKLRQEIPTIDWIEFRFGRDLATEHGPRLRTRLGPEETRPGEGGELTSVMTRLGRDDLATVDTLVTAGIANSRAEVLRWAISRIREHPAYTKLQDRVDEIKELKAQF